MFHWKRQRKDDEAAARAVECAPLGSSPSAVVGTAAGLPGVSSLASSVCSEADALDAASLSSSAPGRLASMGSIELAQAKPLERASVRTKAAFFEALCRANTTVHIQCNAEGPQLCSYPASDVAGGCGSGGCGPRAALVDADMQHADSDEEASDSWQNFSEVHLLLRMPCAQHSGSSTAGPAQGSGKYGSVADMERLIEELQGALELKEAQRKATADAYTRRCSEVEGLQRVVRELAESRSKAVSQRAVLAEKYGELQQEYHRMLRIADLSRTVSKENLAATSRTRGELRRVQSELHATKNHALSLSEKHKKVRVENALLKEKVQLLQRLDFEDVQESEIKKHFTRYRLAETY